MDEKYKYKSSSILTFTYTTFIPFLSIVIFWVGNFYFLCLIVFILWCLSLVWINNIKIYNDRIEISRFLWSHVYTLDDLNSAGQTHLLAPRFCLINFKRGVTWRKFILFMPIPKDSDVFLMKSEESIEFLNRMITEQ